jgi:hypothetical protein
MAYLNETLISCKGHNKNRKFDNSRFSMFFYICLFDYNFILDLLLFLYFLKKLYDSCPFLRVIFEIDWKLFLLLCKVIDLFLQKFSQLCLTTVMFIYKSIFDDIKNTI